MLHYTYILHYIILCYIQGISAVENIIGKPHIVNHNAIPAACFTHPEIAFVGLSEEQCKAKAAKEGFTVYIYYYYQHLVLITVAIIIMVSVLVLYFEKWIPVVDVYISI